MPEETVIESTETENQGAIESTETENQGAIESTETENQGVEFDGADEPEAKPKAITQDDVNRMAVSKQKRINKLQTENDSLAQRLDALEQKAQVQQVGTRPVIPELPDKFDGEYVLKMAQRDKAIYEQRNFDLKALVQKAQAGAATKQKTADAQTARTKAATTFNDRVVKAKMDPVKIAEAAKITDAYVKDDAVGNFIIAQPNGPALLQHLAANPAHLETISALDTVSAVSHILINVVPEMGATKPKTKAPVKVLKGRKAPKSVSKYLEGVTFE